MTNKRLRLLGITGIGLILGIWLLSGLYTVGSGEEAVVLRFGKHVDTVSNAGLNWHIPAPVDKVHKVHIGEVRRIEFGYMTESPGDTSEVPVYSEVPVQSLMLTGDENLVNVEVAIQYRVIDSPNYLFNVHNQPGTIEAAAVSSIRRAVASHDLDSVLTDNKFGIQQEIKDDLQAICNNYNIGVSILAVELQSVYPPSEVDEAFKDVTNAREDRNSYINEAQSYVNDKIPTARGNAAEMVNQAVAYKEKRIAEAKGDVANFLQILEQYESGKEVTRTRMYLETLEEVLPGIEKYIMDENGNVLRFLPLE